jgi:hypothetical protein
VPKRSSTFWLNGFAPVPGRTVIPIGTRVMLSTPEAMTTSCVPLITAWAAKWIACWELPHCRSIETAGTLCGRIEASTAFRPICSPCSPAWLTQPMITSSTAAGSMPLRSTAAERIAPPRSLGCQPASRPLRRPPAVRTASTI